jgi:hypothetical protein
MITIKIQCEERLLPHFLNLLEQGFWIEINTQESVREFLCTRVGLQPAYLDERIQTLFLNGRAVDDVDTATIKAGSILALSAAMPGVLGATLRKKGFFAAMRSQISYTDQEGPAIPKDRGKVRLKLFNLVLAELGPTFLAQGIWVETERVTAFLKDRAAAVAGGCHTLKMDGHSIDWHRMDGMDWDDPETLLKIHTP